MDETEIVRVNKVPEDAGAASVVTSVYGDSVPPLVVRPARPIVLRVRRFQNDGYSTHEQNVDLNSACLVVVDAWGYHPHPRYLLRCLEHQRIRLKPLVSLARRHAIHVVHLPDGQPLSEIIAPLPGDGIVDAKPPYLTVVRDLLDAYLQERSIHALLFAGYASNWCLLNVISSIAPLGYETVLVRDCTLALETNESLQGEWCNYVAINMIERQWGSSISLTGLQRALLSRQVKTA